MKAIVKVTGARAHVLDIVRVNDCGGSAWIYEKGLEEIPTAVTDSKYSCLDLRLVEIDKDTADKIATMSYLLNQLDQELVEIAHKLAAKGQRVTLAGIREFVSEFQGRALPQPEKVKTYCCTVCGVNAVDAEGGFDTCSDCAGKI